MNHLLAVAMGGAVGAVGRYWMSTWIYARLGTDFPWGTLAVNVFGSLLMGFLYVVLLERATLDPVWRALLMVGLLGAFTTFSTFSIESLNLLQSAQFLKAGLNMIVSVLLCIAAAWLGLIIGRQL